MPPFRGIRAHSGTPAAEDHPFHAMIEYHRMLEIARDFFIFSLRAGFNMYLDRLDQLIPACFHITKPYMGRKRGSI